MRHSVKTLSLFCIMAVLYIQNAYADLKHSEAMPVIYKMNPIENPKQDYVQLADARLGDDANKNARLTISSAKPMPKGSYSPRDLRCLSEAIYYEARGEGLAGATAVAEVVLNRTKSRRFPNSVCDVVYSQYKNICQFSFVCNGAMAKPKNQSAWRWSKDLAKKVISGKTNIVSKGALFFHADYVNPSWASKMYRTVQIGSHRFYKPKR